MLSKKILLVTALSTLALSGCQKKTAEIKLDGTQSAQEMQQEGKKLADAIQSGQAIRCTMTNTKNEGQAEYILKEKKMKMIGTGFAENQTSSGGMISDGTYIYTWDDSTQKGFKMKIPDPQEIQQETQEKNQDVPDFSKDEDLKKYEDLGYTVTCTPGEVNDSEFIPPADVQFSDFSSLMEQIPQNVDEGLSEDQQKMLDDLLKENGQ